jgi:hypothetical protein
MTTAITMYRDMGMTYWLEKAKAEMLGGGRAGGNRSRTAAPHVSLPGHLATTSGKGLRSQHRV